MVYQFRIVTYNVMSSGPMSKRKPKRLKHIVRDLIGPEKADFVLLQDIDYEDTEFWKGEMFSQGYEYCMGTDVLKTTRLGIMIFSQIPFESVKFYQFSQTHKHRGLTVCEVDMEGLGSLTLATVWLEHITDGSTKNMVQNQVTSIFKLLKEKPRVILAGDFGQENLRFPDGWTDTWKMRGRGEFGTYHTFYPDRFHGSESIGRRHDYVLFKGPFNPTQFYKIGTRPNRAGLFPSSHDGIVCTYEYEECKEKDPETLEDAMNVDLDLSTLKSVDMKSVGLHHDLSHMDLGPEEDDYIQSLM